MYRQTIHPETREEIRELHKEGLTIANISWYLGIEKGNVLYALYPNSFKKANDKYHKKNRKKLLKNMREYAKKYRRLQKKKAVV